jgi:hypothetical protein
VQLVVLVEPVDKSVELEQLVRLRETTLVMAVKVEQEVLVVLEEPVELEEHLVTTGQLDHRDIHQVLVLLVAQELTVTIQTVLLVLLVLVVMLVLLVLLVEAVELISTTVTQLHLTIMAQ